MVTKRVNVTAAATLLSDQAGKVNQLKVKVRNIGANSVDLGPTNAVASGSGYELKASEEKDIALESGEKLYGICAATFASVVEVMEQYDTAD